MNHVARHPIIPRWRLGSPDLNRSMRGGIAFHGSAPQPMMCRDSRGGNAPKLGGAGWTYNADAISAMRWLDVPRDLYDKLLAVAPNGGYTACIGWG